MYMIKKEELETVWFKLDEEVGGLKAVAIVTDPAIKKSYKMFNNVFSKTTKQEFKTSTEKQELTGPVMIPDMEILRVTNDGHYYNCIFSKDTVKECSEYYLKSCNHTSANFEHEQDNFTKDVYVIESWIVEDPETDKSKALGFTDISKGTWFITYKVANKELWDSIKEESFTGFSIEGFFDTFEKTIDEKYKMKFINSIINSNLSDTEKTSIIQKYIGTV